MERGGVSSMDASAQDVWDWEVLPEEHRSFYAETRAASRAHGCTEAVLAADHDETEEPILPPPSQVGVDECKDIAIDVVPAETRSTHQEPTVAELLASDQDKFHAKEVDDGKYMDMGAAEAVEAFSPDELAAGEEEEEITKEKRARPDCVVFSVGKLSVNAVGALCSFGVAAATVCVFLVGGKLQHHKQQQQKIQLQFLGDDKRIQQVVQQTSRLNQAMSSMMGAGASTRANISFGGFYDGF